MLPTDPGHILVTEDIDQFLAGIAALTADGGDGGTTEPIFGALIRAVEASEPGSSIYVFTDAHPSDERLNEARSLILRKNVKVFFEFVFAGLRKRSLDNVQQNLHEIYHRSKRQARSDSIIYKQLADLSGGQFLNVHTSEISELATLVSFSAIWSRRTLFRRSGVLHGSDEFSIPVDTSVIDVTISINGEGIRVSITTPQG